MLMTSQCLLFLVEFVDEGQNSGTLEGEPLENVHSQTDHTVVARESEDVDVPELNHVDAEDLFSFSPVQHESIVLPENSLDAITLTHHSPELSVSEITQTTPSNLNKRSRNNLFGLSNILNPATSPQLSIEPSWPFSSAHEARLFHYYIKNCAPWVSQTVR